MEPHVRTEHTMEMPQVPEPAPVVSFRHNVSWRWLLVAAVGSFLLGSAVRFGLEFQRTGELSLPWVGSKASVVQLAAGADVINERGHNVIVPVYVKDVLPFMVQNSNPKYYVLGGYILKAVGIADKSKPVMVVISATTRVIGEQVLLVTGRLVMENEGGWIDETLSTTQQSDLRYISERVNYWDRATMLATSVREDSAANN